MSEWEITKDGKTVLIGVGTMPGRKSPALYSVNGSVLTALAYFRSEADAEEAGRLLRLLAQGRVTA